MKAVAVLAPSPELHSESFVELDLPMPSPGPHDLLVQVKAVSVNPVDYKIRRSRYKSDLSQNAKTEPKILGWDAAGIVEAVGSEVIGFKAGDAVYYAGELNRPGSNAEYQLVDARLAAHKPACLSFAEAAALPLTALTAYEMLFEQLGLRGGEDFCLLVIGGAGGVGSIAIQLVRALTQGRVYSTSGSEESRAFLEPLVDGLLDRRRPLREEMDRLGIADFDAVFSTTHSADYLPQLPSIIRPFGKLGLIDDPDMFDIVGLKQRAISIAWEFMFAKALHHYCPESQGQILAEVAKLVDSGKIHTTANLVLQGLNRGNLVKAHAQLESGTSVGKVVIAY